MSGRRLEPRPLSIHLQALVGASFDISDIKNLT